MGQLRSHATAATAARLTPTLATGVAALSWRGRIVMAGVGGGSVPFDFFKVPPGSQLGTSLNGGSIALMEVAELARLGRLKVLVDRYPLSAAKQAYDDVEHGRLVGRAVLMPASAADEDRATKRGSNPTKEIQGCQPPGEGRRAEAAQAKATPREHVFARKGRGIRQRLGFPNRLPAPKGSGAVGRPRMAPHPRMNASRSALTRSWCVAVRPCGAPG
jgi:hypothetical protein